MLKINKLIWLFIFLLFIILIISIFLLSYLSSNPQKTPTRRNITSNNPVLKAGIKLPILSAESSVSVLWNRKTGKEITLYSKNPDEEKPIASITKIMTAAASEDLATADESGKIFRVREIFFPLLIISDNDSATKLAGIFGTSTLLAQMNKLAKGVGATSTTFRNLTGLDALGGNTSTANDLVKIAKLIFTKYNLFIITLTPRYGGIESTDKMLTDPSVPWRVLGGKTGETKGAKQALLLITESPNPDFILINVVLRSDNRDNDMRTLLNWVKESYEWGR
ncbi:MAG: hypothetical protein NTV72_03030 [Candidatus Taylorbacteria bacterium]|nr:hypothetical protein [Candidatus Taylorbacteria bacterium]